MTSKKSTPDDVNDDVIFFVNDLPKATRHRQHIETGEDKQVARLVERGHGGFVVPLGADEGGQRRAYHAAAKRAGYKRALIVKHDNQLYVSVPFTS